MNPLVFSTLGCPDWSLEHAADVAVANAYAGIEIRVLDGDIIPADLSPTRQAEVRNIMQSRGLSIAGLGASTRFTAIDPAERQANVDELRRYIQLANALESPLVRTFGGHVAEGSNLDQAVDWVAEGMAAVMPDAERHGVTVMLETHDAFCRGQEVARVLAQVDSPHAQAIWDVHHPYRMGESVEDTWDFIGARLGHVHLKDARRRDDGGWDLVLMGQGEVPNRAVIDLLLANGYTGAFSAEWEKKWHPEIEEPEVALPQHAEVLRGWLAESRVTED